MLCTCVAKRKFGILLLSFLFPFATSGQTFSEQADTAMLNTLLKRAAKLMATYPDSMLALTTDAQRIAKELQYHDGIAESFKELGNYNWLKGNYATAINYYDSANGIFSNLKREDKLATTYTSIGISYSRMGNYPEARNYLLKALPIAEKLQLDSNIGKIYNALGVIYRNQKNYNKAVAAYFKALAVFKRTKSHQDIAGCFTNIGIVKENLQQYDSAIHYQSKALHLFDSIQNFRGIVTCYNNLSNIFVALNSTATALQYSEKSLATARQKGFFASEVSALSGLGTIHMKLNKPDKAEAFYLTAIKLARSKHYRTELINVLHALSECYRQQRKFEQALNMHRQYADLKDSVINEESLVKINMLESSHDLARKEASIALLKKDNEITKLYRNLILSVTLALIAVGSLVFVLQRNKIRKNKLLLEQQQKLHDAQQALTDEQLKLAKIKEQELLTEIEYKNRSLTTYALSMVQKNEMLEEVKQSVELLMKSPHNQAEHVKRLTRIIDYGITLDKDWDDFRLYFEDVHTDFFQKLKEKFPDLGVADLKLCALIKLNLNMKQAASILRISPDSVKVARYRLRKKFNLQGEDNLTDFVMSI